MKTPPKRTATVANVGLLSFLKNAANICVNKKHGITPKTIKKDIRDSIKATLTQDIGVEYKLEKQEDVKETINKLTDEMLNYAAAMEFEKAAELRDKIKELEKLLEN